MNATMYMYMLHVCKTGKIIQFIKCICKPSEMLQFEKCTLEC